MHIIELCALIGAGPCNWPLVIVGPLAEFLSLFYNAASRKHGHAPYIFWANRLQKQTPATGTDASKRRAFLATGGHLGSFNIVNKTFT